MKVSLKQVLKQKLKLQKLEQQKRAEERKLHSMAENHKGTSELIVNGDQIYRVSVRGGVWSDVSIEVIGAKDELAELVR